MQCPSCLNTNLTPSGDGRLVCDDCGEQFAGFQEEEVDFVLAGTAVTTRQSQSSQAHQIRQRVQSGSIQAPIAKPQTPDDILICEGAFHLTKAIANRLIQLSYVQECIKVPTFEILTSWVRGHHAFADFSSLRRPFQPYHVLSMISLAALYTRSPLLPRDLCRLVNTRQIPFLAALKTIFPGTFEKSEAVRIAFTPKALPVARHVVKYANDFVRGRETWPPLRKFFRSNGDCVSEFQFVLDPLDERLADGKNITSFPVGHLHITLLRLTRLLGLPDVFGARVLRFMELRRTAVKMARVFAMETDGPWDDSKIDTYDVDHIPSYEDAKKIFSKPLPASGDMYGFPTDESLQADIINTMRLCYGREKGGDIVKESEDSGLGMKLSEEWKACKEAMMKWLKYGNPEDIDNVTWTSLSPNVLSGMRGKTLMDYSRLVDDILTEQGEEPPELWGNFIHAFESIGKRGWQQDVTHDDDEDQIDFDHVRTEKTCMYDVDRCDDKPIFEIAEGEAEMQKEAAAYRCDGNYCGVETDYEKCPLREYGDYEISKEPIKPRKRKRRKTPKDKECLVEPAGIGLAWTIISRFFEGTNVVVSGTKVTPTEKSKVVRLKHACDRNMEIVVRYVVGLKLRSSDQSAPNVP